jgi:drug/metabolite transporter (DMT)-like permease
MKSNSTRGYATAILSALFLSTTAILIRYLTQNYDMPPLVLAVWRDVFVFASLLIIFLIFNRANLKLPKNQIRYLVIYGFILAIFNSLWTISVAWNGAAVATVLVYSSTAFTAVLGLLFLKERLDLGKIIAVLLAFGGCLLVSGAYVPEVWQSNLFAILTGFLAGLSYAIYSLMGRSAAQRGLNPWTTLFYTFSFATLFLLLINFTGSGWIPGTMRTASDYFIYGKDMLAWGILFLLAAGPTLLGFGLYNVSLKHLPASVVNLIATSEPVFTTVTAYFLLSEVLSILQITGSILVMGGVILLRVNEDRKKRKAKKSAVTAHP